jgi:hypothetical protein
MRCIASRNNRQVEALEMFAAVLRGIGDGMVMVSADHRICSPDNWQGAVRLRQILTSVDHSSNERPQEGQRLC